MAATARQTATMAMPAPPTRSMDRREHVMLCAAMTWLRHVKTAMACLERVGMEGFADRQIGQLSGGQQQRVFLARALAQGADLYLLDEPFAGVDAATEKAIIAVLKQLKAQGKTVIAVHHDLATVPEYFDRVFLINTTRIAEGCIADAFTDAYLQEAYGGRLATAQLSTAV